MKFLKQFHRTWLISIILWVVVVFFAVFKLPNLTNLISNNGQPQFNKESQITQANQLQEKWGRGINNTSRVSIVYHRSDNQAISDQQQLKINQAINQLAKKSRQFGIQRITDVNSNPNGKLQLVSADQTTEIVNVYVSKNTATDTAWNQNLSTQMKVSGLANYVTSNEVLAQQNAQRVNGATRMITIVAMLLSIIILGLLLKSLIAPIISIIAIIVSYLTSVSIITNLATHAKMPFFSYIPMITLLVTVILGTLTNFIMFRQTMINGENYRDNFMPVWQTVKEYHKPFISTTIILTLIFLGFAYMPFSPFRSLTAIAIPVIILALVTLTLTPILIGLIGNKLIWPSKVLHNAKHAKLWNKLTRFSLWQPLAGLLVVAYIVGPSLFTFKNNFNYNGNEVRSSTTQATMGSQILNTHFTSGKSTPVTVYIDNPRSLDNATDLQQIDSLTNKLKSMPGVNSVYSVTQPSGLPISKYYVYTQLNSITTQVNGAQKQIHSIMNAVNKGKSNFKTDELEKQINNLDKAKSAADELSNNTSQIQSQISQATSNASTSSKTKSSQNVTAYVQRIKELSQALSTAEQLLAQVNVQGQNIGSYSSTTADNLQTYKEQLGTVKNQLTAAHNKANSVNSSLDDTYDYIQGLAKSSAANIYYITPNQIADTDFQQSLFNYTSQNMKMTQIEVIFTNNPDQQNVINDMKTLRNEINVQFQGTSLDAASVVTTGQPEQQAEIQTNFQNNVQRSILIVAIISLICLFILSRAILQPIYWVAIFIASAISGMEITSLIMHFTFGNGNLNWQAEIILIALLTAIAVWQLVPIAIAYRNREGGVISWLEPTLTLLGQMVRYIWIIVIVIALSCFFHATLSAFAVGLSIIATVVIFNIVLPILISALGKLGEILPQSKNKK